MSVPVPEPDPGTSRPQPRGERASFRISLAWRFFLFFAVLLGLVLGLALLVAEVPTPVVMVAAGALLVAAPAAWLLAQQTLKPLAQMSAAAQKAAAGDYRVRMDVDADDEFGQLAQGFDSLCADLAERAALGAYAAAATRRGAATPGHGVAAARADDGLSRFLPVTHGQPTLLGVDLRRFVEPVEPVAVATVLASLADAARAAAAVALAQDGRLLTAGATRLVFGFEGDLRLPRALASARQILGADPRTAAALLEGEAAAGSIEFEPGACVSTLFGPASQQIERLLSESPAGTVLLPRGLGDASKALLGETRVGVTQGMLSGKPFYCVTGQDLDALQATTPATAVPTAAEPVATSAARIDAATLEHALRQCGPMPLAAALRLARQLCAGIDAAHALGIAHGDIRAGTILLDADGSVKLAGYGRSTPQRGEGAPGSTFTSAAAPETPADGGPDLRGDIHAFGVVLREAFDATLPAPGIAADAGMATDAAAAAAFNALIRSCIRADSGSQFATTRELCAALEQIRT